MVERGGGQVVSLSSDSGRVGSSGEAVYAACKGGIIAFTKSVARELARKHRTGAGSCITSAVGHDRLTEGTGTTTTRSALNRRH
jgi:NAD(P)-dependent dehydrogenase (short-subunit alcohol dehydrogenase family)